LNFEIKDTCLFTGEINIPEKEIKSETNNSNNNLNTEDKTITDFKEITNLTKLVEINNQYNECSINKNNDATFKLTNSDFDKMLNNNPPKVAKEKNLLELENFNTNEDLINNENQENNLINLNQTFYEQDIINILINESSIYEKISENTNKEIKENNCFHKINKNGPEKINIDGNTLDEHCQIKKEKKSKESKESNNVLINDKNQEYYYIKTSCENIYKIDDNIKKNNNKFDLYKNDQNDKIEKIITKSENLTLDISNCESKSLDAINTNEQVFNKSTNEKEIIISNKSNPYFLSS